MIGHLWEWAVKNSQAIELAAACLAILGLLVWPVRGFWYLIRWLRSRGGGKFAPELTEPALYAIGVVPEPFLISGAYGQYKLDVRLAGGEKQLLSIVADCGRSAPTFDTEQKDVLWRVASEYLSVGMDLAQPPFRVSDFARYEFKPTSTGRVVKVSGRRDGVMMIEVYQQFSAGVNWDWIMAEGYTCLLASQDDRVRALYGKVRRATVVVTISNIQDLVVTTKGLRADLIPSGRDQRGERSRIPCVQSDDEILATEADAWKIIKQFTKRALADTGSAHFEKDLDSLKDDQLYPLYFAPVGHWQRWTEVPA